MIPWSPTASSPSSRASSRSPEVEDRSAGAPAGSPAPRRKRDGLLQRREGGGQEDLVLLRQQPVRSSRWGPDALLPCLVPHSRALVEARVSPDVDDLVERADLRVPEGGQLGVLLPVLVGLTVALLDLSQAARRDAVGPDLVDHVRLLSAM